MWGNRAQSWKTMPTRRRSGGTQAPGPVTSAEPSLITPRSGRSKPAMARSRVVLPQPLGPSRDRCSPGATSSPMPSKTGPDP